MYVNYDYFHVHYTRTKVSDKLLQMLSTIIFNHKIFSIVTYVRWTTVLHVSDIFLH
jgi:hypothetical protein